ncbi:ABC transporter permease [Halosegnis marinus]|uniref:ABC transporter permease n=1 Tax=Halosegnis marinus TaxID=3034023 RepID=A0ABD5ZN14_9EURY|nr:ABC transporter permease subunit [Halosegnis sp. DT85]
MSWRAVARNDLRTLRRSRGAVGLTGVLLLVYVGLAGVFLYVGEPDFAAYTDVLGAVLAILAPLLAVVFGYGTVVEERGSGTATLALSLPHSRRSLVAGKLAARTGLFAAATWLATLVAGAVTLAAFPAFDAATFLGLSLLATGYGVVFLAFAVGLSALFASTRRVIAAALGGYFALVVAWGTLVDVVGLVLFRLDTAAFMGDYPTWAAFARMFSPGAAFDYLRADLLDVGTLPAVTRLSDAWFVSTGGAALALLAWAVVPLALGYLRFRATDL